MSEKRGIARIVSRDLVNSPHSLPHRDARRRFDIEIICHLTSYLISPRAIRQGPSKVQFGDHNQQQTFGFALTALCWRFFDSDSAITTRR